MGCGQKCIKTVLIIVNVLFFLAGLGLLGVGIWMRVDKTLEKFNSTGTSLEEFRSALYTSAYILIGFGGFTVLVAFCGCCGAIKDSKCLLGVYITLVGVVLAGQIAGGVYAYVKKDDLIESFEKSAKTYLQDKYVSNKTADDQAFDFVMIYFQCCGVSGPSDFGNDYYNRTKSVYYPAVCCEQTNPTDGIYEPKNAAECDTATKSLSGDKNHTIKQQGCSAKIQEYIKDKAVILLGVAGGVAGFELIVLIAAIGYCCTIEED